MKARFVAIVTFLAVAGAARAQDDRCVPFFQEAKRARAAARAAGAAGCDDMRRALSQLERYVTCLKDVTRKANAQKQRPQWRSELGRMCPRAASTSVRLELDGAVTELTVDGSRVPIGPGAADVTVPVAGERPQHTVRAVGCDGTAWKRSIPVRPGSTLGLKVTVPAACVRVQSSGPLRQLIVRDDGGAATPIASPANPAVVGVRPGPVTIEALGCDASQHRATVTARAGETTAVELTTPPVGCGRLALHAERPMTRVRLGEQDRAVPTPSASLTVPDVAAGALRVHVTTDDGRGWSATVTVVVGQMAEVRFQRDGDVPELPQDTGGPPAWASPDRYPWARRVDVLPAMPWAESPWLAEDSMGGALRLDSIARYSNGIRAYAKGGATRVWDAITWREGEKRGSGWLGELEAGVTGRWLDRPTSRVNGTLLLGYRPAEGELRGKSDTSASGLAAFRGMLDLGGWQAWSTTDARFELEYQALADTRDTRWEVGTLQASHSILGLATTATFADIHRIGGLELGGRTAWRTMSTDGGAVDADAVTAGVWTSLFLDLPAGDTFGLGLRAAFAPELVDNHVSTIEENKTLYREEDAWALPLFGELRLSWVFGATDQHAISATAIGGYNWWGDARSDGPVLGAGLSYRGDGEHSSGHVAVRLLFDRGAVETNHDTDGPRSVVSEYRFSTADARGLTAYGAGLSAGLTLLDGRFLLGTSAWAPIGVSAVVAGRVFGPVELSVRYEFNGLQDEAGFLHLLTAQIGVAVQGVFEH